MYKRILVAVDGSATSLRGLDEALRLAKAVGARLLIVHVLNAVVLETEIASTAYYQALEGELRSMGSKILEHAAMKARESGVAF